MALFGGSEQALTVVIRARDEASKIIQGAEKQLKSFAATNEKTLRDARNLSAAATGAIVALGVASVNAASQAEAEMAKFNATLATMGTVGERARDGILKAAEAAVKLGFDDEEAANTIAVLLQRTGDLTQALQLNGLAMDLARAKGIALSDAGRLISMVMSGNARALKEYGIEISDTLSPTEALVELQKRVTGQALAFSNTFAGQSQVLRREMDNLAETLGQMLIPRLTGIVRTISGATSALREWTSAHPTAVSAISTFAAGISGLTLALTSTALVLPKVIGYMRTFIALVAATNPALTALGVAVGVIVGKLVEFGDEVGGLGRAWHLTVMQMALDFYRLIDKLPFVDMKDDIMALEREMEALAAEGVAAVTKEARQLDNVGPPAFEFLGAAAEDAADKVKKAQQAIADTKRDLQSLQRALLGDDRAAARAFAEQEQSIFALRKEATAEEDPERRKELLARIDKEQAALDRARPQFQGAMGSTLDQERSRTLLTDFERGLQDIKERKLERLTVDFPQIVANINFNEAVVGSDGIKRLIEETLTKINRAATLQAVGGV